VKAGGHWYGFDGQQRIGQTIVVVGLAGPAFLQRFPHSDLSAHVVYAVAVL
jgi:hypothetical protein